MGRAVVEISYPHIHRQVYFPESQIKVVKLDVKTKGRKLGYIMGAGDDVADSLRHLGYEVTMLTTRCSKHPTCPPSTPSSPASGPTTRATAL